MSMAKYVRFMGYRPHADNYPLKFSIPLRVVPINTKILREATA